MKHVVKDGQSYFSFLAEDSEGGGGPGESLQHRLFKEILASIRKTQLRLGHLGVHDIRVIHSEIEKEVTESHARADRRFVDNFLVFETDTDLSERWQGKLCIEVWYEHRVDSLKMALLRELRVPTIEFKLPDELAYKYAEDDTSDAREREYVERMVSVIERNYIAARVISDPQTVENLERTISSMSREREKHVRDILEKDTRIKDLETELDAADETKANTEATNKALKDSLSSVTAERDRLLRRGREFERRLTRLQVYCAVAFLAGIVAGYAVCYSARPECSTPSSGALESPAITND